MTSRQIALSGVVTGLVWALACSPRAAPLSGHLDEDAGLGGEVGRDAAADGPSSSALSDSASREAVAADVQPGGDAAPDNQAPDAHDDPCACVHGTCLSADGCACEPSWGGRFCSESAPILSPEVPVAGSVTQGHWAYFSFTGHASGLSITVTEDTTMGLVGAYLSTGSTPTQTSNLAADEGTSSMHKVTHTFESPGTQPWFLAVYGQPAIPTATQVVTFTVQLAVIN